jgi:hypothetical protein
MAQRRDPEPVYQARRAATLQNVIRTTCADKAAAERLMVAWERQAERQGLDRSMNVFWNGAERWIESQPRELPRR